MGTVVPSHRWIVVVTLALCVIALAEFSRELFEDDDVSRLDRQIADRAVEVRSAQDHVSPGDGPVPDFPVQRPFP